MFDIWSMIWLLAILFAFPFGYKPTIALLSVSSIFQASKMITLGGTNLPLFFCMELIAFLRLCLPSGHSGLIKIQSKKVIFILVLIILIWFQTYLNTFIFENIMVFSSSLGSNEYSVATGGTPLVFSSANINQLVLLTMSLLLASALYARREFIDQLFYFKTLCASIFIFIFFGLLWKFSNDLYNLVASVVLNNDYYSINVFNESRLSSTFSEPSFAGLFIGTFCFPFLFNKNIWLKLIGIILLYLAILNLSSTLVFAMLVSMLMIFIRLRGNLNYKLFIFIFGFIFLLLIYFVFHDYIFQYLGDKASSDSGTVRNAVNFHIIENIVNSYFMGVGLGSERASSLILTMLNNLGVILSFLLIYCIYRLLNREKKNLNSLLLLCLASCFFGSFASMQEITIPFLWNLIFANIVCGSPERKVKLVNTYDRNRGQI